MFFKEWAVCLSLALVVVILKWIALHSRERKCEGRVVLVDFDGVLHSYSSGWRGGDQIPDDPVPGAIEWLKRMILDSRHHNLFSSPEKRFRLAIYSSRSNCRGGIAAMQRWLKKHGLEDFYVGQILFPKRKPVAWLTIGDRAFQFRGAFPTYQQIENFKPWYREGFYD